MPTLLVVEGYRFWFYSNEREEPPHVHVSKGGGVAKVWLQPVLVAYSFGFTRAQTRRVRELVLSTRPPSWRGGMSTSIVSPPNARARGIEFVPDAFVVHLEDGRSLTVPIEWFPRLRDATTEQRDHWELIRPGLGFRWPDLDEDISVAGLLGLPD